MPRVRCQHCGWENDAVESHGYCDDCGKKLPSTGLHAIQETSSPSLLSIGAKKRKSRLGRTAMWVLIAVGAIHIVRSCLGGGDVGGIAHGLSIPHDPLVFVLIQVVGFAVLFGGLSVLACYRPVLAALLGTASEILLLSGLILVVPRMMEMPISLIIRLCIVGILAGAAISAYTDSRDPVLSS